MFCPLFQGSYLFLWLSDTKMPWSRKGIWCVQIWRSLPPFQKPVNAAAFSFSHVFPGQFLNRSNMWNSQLYTLEKFQVNIDTLNTLYIWLSVPVHLSLESFSVLFLQFLFSHCSFWMYFSPEKHWNDRCKW